MLLHTTRFLDPSYRTLPTTYAGICAGIDGGGSLLTRTGCDGAADSEASMRFTNATVDNTRADFYPRSTLEISKLAKGGSITSWRKIEGNRPSLRCTTVEAHQQPTETRTLDEDSYTSVVAYGSLYNSAKFRFFAETNSSAGSGRVKVRLFHAALTNSLSGLSPTRHRKRQCRSERLRHPHLRRLSHPRHLQE